MVSTLELVPPRVQYVPTYESSLFGEACDLWDRCGLQLDPWQLLVLEAALGRVGDRWAATEVGLCLPRQNGKNVILEARELVGLFLLGDEDLLLHSAHHFKTAKEHFLRLLATIESTPELEQQVKRVVRSHGEEGIELVGGKRLLFLARTKSGGRGFTAPFVAFDEAMYLAEASMGALMPTQSARKNRQRWYAGSAVDQIVHPDGVVFARVRERAFEEKDPRLVYFEWSIECEKPEELPDELLEDERAWASANPAYGVRIEREAIEDELRTLDARTFAVERLGVGDWPATSDESDLPISLEHWQALVDEQSTLADPVCFAFDVAPDRASASIAAAGRRPFDDLFHVEVIAHRRGTGWVVPELARLYAAWNPLAIVLDATGPAGSLVHRCEQAGFSPEPISATDHARACGLLADTVEQELLRHLGSGELLAALKGATTRSLGDAWAWSRKHSSIDISPLVAVTLALWGANSYGWSPGEDPVIY